MPTKSEIEAHRAVVQKEYAKGGGRCLPEGYKREFDKLHDMNMQHMAAKYRNTWGLGPNAETPYCNKNDGRDVKGVCNESK